MKSVYNMPDQKLRQYCGRRANKHKTEGKSLNLMTTVVLKVFGIFFILNLLACLGSFM